MTHLHTSLRSLLYICVASAAMLICTTSCKEEHATNARPPVFESLTLTPSVVSPRAHVDGTIVYKTVGQHIYKTDYSLTVSNSDTTYGKTWSVVGQPKSPLQIPNGFEAPTKPGTYTVKVATTKVYYETGGPNGELYGTPTSTQAQLTVQ